MRLDITRRAERVAIARLASARPIWAARTGIAVPAVQRARLLQSILSSPGVTQAQCRQFPNEKRSSTTRRVSGRHDDVKGERSGRVQQAWTGSGSCVLRYCASWDDTLLGPGGLTNSKESRGTTGVTTFWRWTLTRVDSIILRSRRVIESTRNLSKASCKKLRAERKGYCEIQASSPSWSRGTGGGKHDVDR